MRTWANRVCAVGNRQGQLNVVGSNLLSGDPKSGFELEVGCRPSHHGGSFLLFAFEHPTVEFLMVGQFVSIKQ